MKGEKQKPKTKNILRFVLFFCAFSFAFFAFGFGVANAATLYFSPSSGNFSVGDLLNTSVLVNTQNKAINNSDAVINFPAGFLEVVSLNKSGSIFTLWVEEPAFSNSAGTISFNGGLPTPGYNGSAGRLLNITFRVRNAGLASLVFSSAAVRANDGYGTDILQTKSQAQFNLVSEERPVAPTFAPGIPQAPGITSPSHPDSNKWYPKNAASFTWPVPLGVDAVRLLVGRIATAQPIVFYTPAISQRTVENLEDGIWYFHARFRNDVGWGETTHFKLQIDTQQPYKFNINVIEREDLTDPIIKLRLSATDRTSGIDRYEINSEETSILSGAPSVIFESSAMGPGTHIVTAKAIDKAGNFLQDSVEIEIKAIDPPRITEYRDELNDGEILIVRGETYPDSEVILYLARENREQNQYSVRSDSEGKFRFVGETDMQRGDYKLWAEVKDKRGARSLPSEKLSITVNPSAVFGVGTSVIATLIIAIIIISLVGLMIFIFMYMKHQLVKFKARLRKDVHKIETDVHKAFDLLKEDIRDQIKLLERTRTKRQLTEEEEKIISRLKKHFDEAEKFIEKEIEDVEKKVK